METRIQKWGNSLALRIPQAFALEVGLMQDCRVELTLEEGCLVITPLPATQFTLEDLLAGVTPDNRHGEIDTGPAVGNEAW